MLKIATMTDFQQMPMLLGILVLVCANPVIFIIILLLNAFVIALWIQTQTNHLFFLIAKIRH
jgi:hypothetical protein